MNIGDKVRLLRGTESGIIRKVIDKRMVEVEIEDGFLIPVLKSEVVVISSDERKNFKSEAEITSKIYTESSDNQPVENAGLFLALESQNNILTGWIINNTIETILFSVHQQGAKEVSGLSHGILSPFSYAKIENWSLENLLNLPLLIIDIIEFNHKKENHTSPITKKVDIKPKILNRKPQEIPLTKSTGVLINLKEEQMKPDPEVIKNALFTEENDFKIKERDSRTKMQEIDLHIEALVDDVTGLGNDDILNTQLSHFERSLDAAVIAGFEQITFIHGIGNGTLRNQIHRKLSQYPHIKYFEDAQKEKFGYGATKVQLK